MELTKDTIKILKTANTVVARYSGTDDRSTLEVIVEDRETMRDISRSEIPVRSALSNYDRENPDVFKGSAACLYAKQSDEWNTLLNIVRPGDELTVHWIVANDSQTLRKAGLHHDQCKIVINRRTKTTWKKFIVTLYDSISLNNSARMVQVGG